MTSYQGGLEAHLAGHPKCSYHTGTIINKKPVPITTHPIYYSLLPMPSPFTTIQVQMTTYSETLLDATHNQPNIAIIHNNTKLINTTTAY